MSEPAIKLNQQEAARLFARGVAAARSGQRRVAAGLLARAVQLDPRHEQAWLWLSGVMEDPAQIAFCLRSVLSINPHNDRARQGLAWLEQRGQIAAQPSPAAVLDAPAEPSPSNQFVGHPQEHEASWWVSWRRSHREMRRAWVFVWSALIVPWLLLLGLNLTLRQTVERNAALVLAAAAEPTALPATPTAIPAPILQASLGDAQNAQLLAYLSALQVPRQRLQEAVQSYREVTSKPGGLLVTHAAAAHTLRDQVEAAYKTIAELTPPPALEQAHASYLAGLEQERAAMDDMLEFYGSFSVQFANRATLRMLDAGRHFDRARAVFHQFQMRANAPERHFTQTMR